ncbi:MAG: hypothetical protein P4M09_03575 [Devosia sp.]|nr:hypothetical protein [Devosia sp.]
MKLLHDIGNELKSLFVDDGSLALFAAVLIAVVTGAVKLINVPPLAGGVVLLAGLVAILVESLMRAARAGKK